MATFEQDYRQELQRTSLYRDLSGDVDQHFILAFYDSLHHAEQQVLQLLKQHQQVSGFIAPDRSLLYGVSPWHGHYRRILERHKDEPFFQALWKFPTNISTDFSTKDST